MSLREKLKFFPQTHIVNLCNDFLKNIKVFENYADIYRVQTIGNLAQNTW